MGLLADIKDLVSSQDQGFNDYNNYPAQPSYTPQPAIAQQNSVQKQTVSESFGAVPTDPHKNLTYKVILVRPESFARATEIGRLLIEGAVVIINCENTQPDVTQRITDFLAGCALALDGTIMKTATNSFIVAPKNFAIDTVKQGDE